MVPVNNSDLAWLITADYNQDNAIGYPDELREDVLDPEIDQWHQQDDHTFKHSSYGGRHRYGRHRLRAGSGRGEAIGGQRPIGRSCLVTSVGGNHETTPDNVGGVQYGSLVGGHYTIG